MKNFSLGVTKAPCLTGIRVEDQNIHWKGDLNTTIQQLFIEKEVTRSNETVISSYLQDDEIACENDDEIACEDGTNADAKE